VGHRAGSYWKGLDRKTERTYFASGIFMYYTG
jgi:hypothetical protein